MAPRCPLPNSLEESSSRAGRIRLPPPARRYSPMSVMTRTLETVSRPNSRSMAARSSRNSSKISRALVAGCVAMKSCETPIFSLQPLRNRMLNRPVIRELHINAKVGILQQRDDLLQGVAIAPADPHQVPLDGCLHLLLGVFDFLDDFARF